MQALNYVPNEYARVLKSNISKTIGVSIPSIWNPFFSEFVFHIDNILTSKGYKLLICNNNCDSKRELEFLKMLSQNKVDGIIAFTYSNIEKYVSANLPFVSLDRYFDEEVAYVTSDNYHGGELAAQELINKGCKHLGYVAAIAPQKNNTLRRKDGFIDYAKKHAIPTYIFERPEPILDYDSFFSDFFKTYPNIDGILAMNDQTAHILLEYLDRKNIKVPEDIQIVGYDGFCYFQGLNTYLTTIKQPIEDMAQASIDSLFSIINGNGVPKPKILPVSFQQGKTTLK